MEGTKYATIFLVCVIFGTVLEFSPMGRLAVNRRFDMGMQGLLVEQQIQKDEMEFKREIYRRELDAKYREAEHQRQLEILRLQRPARPDEGY
jgi:hypothetical protein